MNTKTNDASIANIAGRDQRIETIRAWGQAEVATGAALVACFVTVAQTGATEPGEIAEARGWYGRNVDGERVPSSSCAAYASTFNRAAKVSSVLGINPTVKLIKDAAKGAEGRAKEAVYNALGAALTTAKSDGVKEATAAQGRAIVKAALASAAEKAVEKKASTKRGTREPSAAKLAQAAVDAGKGCRDVYAAVRLVCNQAGRVPEPEGREAAWRAAMAKLQDAAEALAVFK